MSFLKSKTFSGRSVGGSPDGLIMYCGRGVGIIGFSAGVGILWGSASISGVVGAGFAGCAGAAGSIGRVKVSGGAGITGLGVGVGTGAGAGAGGAIIGLGGKDGAGVGTFLKSTISGIENVGSRYSSAGLVGVEAVGGATGRGGVAAGAGAGVTGIGVDVTGVGGILGAAITGAKSSVFNSCARFIAA